MEFRTKVELPVNVPFINHSDRLMLWGSCFAENIGKLFIDNKFRCDVNPFGVAGLVAAYTEGEEWLEELKTYLYDNYLYLKDFFRNELPDFPVLPLEGTYLVWADCSVLGMRSEDIERRLLLDSRLWINAGIHYGEEGDSFIRINIACPKSMLTDGLKRLASGLGAMMR